MRTTPRAYVPTFAEQTVARSGMTFKNRQHEDRFDSEFDHRLSQEVGGIEGIVIGHAAALRGEIGEVSKAAKSIAAELREMRFALEEDGEIDVERWSVLDGTVDRLIADAAVYPTRAEALDARLADPLGYASELQARFPSLHRPDLVAQALGTADQP